MILGYARTSTTDQRYSIEAQLEELKAVKCEQIYQEQVSAVGDRPEFDKMVDFARQGDTVIVTKLDRAFRSVRHMGEIMDCLTDKGVALRILDMGVDSSTPNGKMILGILTSVAQFEREIMKERQKEGIKRAQAEDKYKGRKRKIDPERIKELDRMGYSAIEIAQTLNICRASVYRYKKG